VLDLVVNHSFAVICLLTGGAFVITAVVEFLKHRSILGMVLLMGVAFTAVGLLDLTALIAAEWIAVCRNALIGILFVWTNIYALQSPPSPSVPDWTKWAGLVFGVGFIIAAIFDGLHHYWR
jgi:hypothetical protein